MIFMNVTAKQYRKMIEPQKGNKYHAKKTEADGVVFDSKYEAEVWNKLKMLERIGQIKDLERQKRFILQEEYINNKKEKIRPISYIADFSYIRTKDNQKIVMDTKSSATRTPVYLIKKKMFEYKYKDYLFVEEKK